MRLECEAGNRTDESRRPAKRPYADGQVKLDGSLFLFCSKQRRILIIIYWDRNDFRLWVKRLTDIKNMYSVYIHIWG